MNLEKRIGFVKAMDTIVNSIDDEILVEDWLRHGVADGDITSESSDEEIGECYCDDDQFKWLMKLFSDIMRRAIKQSGFTCDGITVVKGLS